MTISRDLGTLSILPREVRDRIYDYTLYVDPDYVFDCGHRLNKTALLRTSHAIYDEASVSFSRVNPWTIHIRRDWKKENVSIMGRPGFVMSITHYGVKKPPPHCDHDHRSCAGCMQVPRSVLKYARDIEVMVSAFHGFGEADIVPTTAQLLMGPERPAFRPVIEVANEACALLKQCKKIHRLAILAFCSEDTPGSSYQALEPFTHLRGIKYTECFVGQEFKPDKVQAAFELKEAYTEYLQNVMSLPEGTETPEYVHVPDEDEDEGMDPNSIFFIAPPKDDYEYYDEYDALEFAGYTSTSNVAYDEDFENAYELAFDRPYDHRLPAHLQFSSGTRGRSGPDHYGDEDALEEEDWRRAQLAFNEATRIQPMTIPAADSGYPSRTPNSYQASNVPAPVGSTPSGLPGSAPQPSTAQAAGPSRPSGTTQSASQSTRQETRSSAPPWPPEFDPAFVPEPPHPIFMGPPRPPTTFTGPHPPPPTFGPPRPPTSTGAQPSPPTFGPPRPPTFTGPHAPPPNFFGDEESYFPTGAGLPIFDGMALHPGAIRDFIHAMKPR